nr:MAG: hypothetical protein DIU55_12990 [Bacillota bacterium]
MPKPYLRMVAGLSGGVVILLTMWLWSASVPAPPAVGSMTIASTSAGPPADPTARDLVPAEDVPTVPVLLYHHLEPGADGTNGAIISTAEFERQMAWLKANGYTSITTAQLLSWLEDGQPLPERPVMITFDDGYRSNYTYAYPVLQQHGFNAIIFMLTGLAGQKFGTLEYLTWEDMRAMAASGLIEIHAHSHDGHRYIGEDPALIAWSAEEILADWHQLTGAMAAAGLPAPTAYAYPFGEYDEECIDALRAAGVKLGFTVEHGRVGQDHDALRLNRLVVYPGMDECGFARLVTGRSVCH